MRTIKFRAWDKDSRKMYDVISLYDDLSCRVQHQDKSWFIYRPRCEVMQFTGLLDKNGKEVYEGDIIHHDTHNENYSIVFEDGCFMYNMDKGSLDYLVELTTSNIKVIGNIYENSYLLENKDE